MILVGRGAGMTHHSVMSYQERLATYVDKLARSKSRSLSTSLEHYQERPSLNMTSLFAPPPIPELQGPNGGLDQAALDDVGRALGGAAQASLFISSLQRLLMMVHCMHDCHCHKLVGIPCFIEVGVLISLHRLTWKGVVTGGSCSTSHFCPELVEGRR